MSQEPLEVQATDAAAQAEAYENSGNAAAVFKPRFGQAHQQYFTPKWLADTMVPIAEHAFGFHRMEADKRPRLNVLDPQPASAAS